MQASLSFTDAPRTLVDIMDSLCACAGSFRGGRGEWKRLRGAFGQHYAQAQQADADQAFLAQLAETVAPPGSLWARSATGPRYQLRAWAHQVGAPRPSPSAVLDATGEGEGRRRPHLSITSRDLLGASSRWRRIQ